MAEIEVLEELGRRFITADRELVLALKSNDAGAAVDARFYIPADAMETRWDRMEKKRMTRPHSRAGRPDGQRGLWIRSSYVAAWLGAGLLDAAEKLERLEAIAADLGTSAPDGGPPIGGYAPATVGGAA